MFVELGPGGDLGVDGEDPVRLRSVVGDGQIGRGGPAAGRDPRVCVMDLERAGGGSEDEKRTHTVQPGTVGCGRKRHHAVSPTCASWIFFFSSRARSESSESRALARMRRARRDGRPSAAHGWIPEDGNCARARRCAAKRGAGWAENDAGSLRSSGLHCCRTGRFFRSVHNGGTSLFPCGAACAGGQKI